MTSTCKSCGQPTPQKRKHCTGCWGARESPKLAADAPEYTARGGCDVCPMEPICRRRLNLSASAVVMCEIPDEFDLMAMDAEGFPYVIMEAA